MLAYVYISENSISKKCHIFHAFVDFGTLSTPLLNCFRGFDAQEQKRKIPYVKPFPGFDSNRKSNVKLWRNLKKVFFFTKLEAGGKPSTRFPPETLVELSYVLDFFKF